MRTAGWRDKHDEAYSCFSKFCEHAKNWWSFFFCCRTLVYGHELIAVMCHDFTDAHECSFMWRYYHFLLYVPFVYCCKGFLIDILMFFSFMACTCGCSNVVLMKFFLISVSIFIYCIYQWWRWMWGMEILTYRIALSAAAVACLFFSFAH